MCMHDCACCDMCHMACVDMAMYMYVHVYSGMYMVVHVCTCVCMHVYRCTCAMTSVAAWMSALTTVGPSIASGNQECTPGLTHLMHTAVSSIPVVTVYRMGCKYNVHAVVAQHVQWYIAHVCTCTLQGVQTCMYRGVCTCSKVVILGCHFDPQKWSFWGPKTPSKIRVLP